MRRFSLLLVLCSCTRPEPWPDWPIDRSAARTLAAEQTVRAPAAEQPEAEASADEIAEAVRLRTLAGATRVGWPAIVAWLQERVDAHPERPFYLLWGTYHDAPAQLEALARVLGPLGVEAPWLLVAEQLAATGRWPQVPDDCQRGDELLLARYRSSGSRASLRAVYDDQHEENHTARRYGVLDATMSVLVAARASRIPVLGCDLPTCLREYLWDVTDDESMRTRELHCALALRRTLGASHPPERVVMLWGLAHVGPEGMPRFLPADADVVSIRVFGGRQSAIGADIARRLGLSEPVLLPLEGRDPILLVPDARSFARRMRNRDPAVTPPELAGQVHAFSQTPGELILPGCRVRLDIDSVRVPAQPGHVPFVFVTGDGPMFVGALDLAPNEWVDVEIDARERLIVTKRYAPNPNVGHTERL